MQSKKRGIVWRDETEHQIHNHEIVSKNNSKSPSPQLERKFVCDFEGCEQKFSRLEHLNRHKRKHTGEKPFECPVPSCKKRFSRYDNMTQHLRSHESLRFKKEVKRLEKEAKDSNEGISFIDSTRLASISFETVVNELSTSNKLSTEVSQKSNISCNNEQNEGRKSKLIKLEATSPSSPSSSNSCNTKNYEPNSSFSLKDIKLQKDEDLNNSSPSSSSVSYTPSSNLSSNLSDHCSPCLLPEEEIQKDKINQGQVDQKSTVNTLPYSSSSFTYNNFETLRGLVQEPSVLFLQKNPMGQFLSDCQILSLFKPFSSSSSSSTSLTSFS